MRHSVRNKLWLLLAAGLLAATGAAQHLEQPFKGTFYDEQEKIRLCLDLYQPTLQAPGMSFLGKLHGYMQGNIYGVWLITSFKIKKQTATLRLSDDLGADSQSIKLTLEGDSLLHYEAIDGNHIRRVEKRKLVKIPDRLTFKRTSDPHL